jgi:phosphate uptake regulator
MKGEKSMSKLIQEKREARKLQVTGGSTYILSLPKRWVEEMNLKRGSQVSLTQQRGGSLLILPKELERPDKPLQATLDVLPNDDPDTVVRKMISTYLIGYNLIYIRAKEQRLTSNQRNAIKDFARRKLVGTEIVDDSPTLLTLQVLLSYPELSVENALRRMCIIAASMHRDAITSLKELNENLAQDIVTMDDEVDRFSFYIIRQLKAAVQSEKILEEIGLSTARDCLGYRLITKTVERVADHAVKIAQNVLTLKNFLALETFQKIYEMSTSADSVFNDAVRSLFKRDFHLADEVVERTKKITLLEKETIKAISKETHAEEASSLRLIIESIRRIAEYASDIAEVVLNLTIEDIIGSQLG